MNEEILQNIHNHLVSEGLTESDYNTWVGNIQSSDEIKNNVYSYLVDNGLTESEYDAWNNNVFGEVKKKENSDLSSSETQEPSELDGVMATVPIFSEEGESNNINSLEYANTQLSAKENAELEKLYFDFKESGQLSTDELDKVQEKIAKQKAGDFGFFSAMKDVFMIKNPLLADALGLKYSQVDKEEDLVSSISREKQIDFLNELPENKRQEVLNYAMDRGVALSEESSNAVAFNEILSSRFDSLFSELKHLEKAYKNAESNGTINNLTPEFFEDIDSKFNELNSIKNKIDRNNSTIENNSEDLSTFGDEIDLLRRNYSDWHNFKNNLRLSTARLIYGGKQKVENTTSGILDPVSSDLGYALSELFGEGQEVEAEKIKSKYEGKTQDNIDALMQINKEFETLRPKMTVDGIENATDFGQWASEQIAQQIPIITTIMMSGGTLGSATVGVASGGGKELEMRSTNKYGDTDFTEQEIALASIGYGTAEFFFEKIGTGAILDSGRRAYTSMVKEGLKNEFKQGVRNNFEAIAREGVTEGLTEFFQNGIDRHYLGDKEVGLFDNVGEAMAAGGFMGSAMHVVPSLAGAMMRPFSTQKNRDYVAENNEKIAKYKQHLENNEDLTDATRKILETRIDALEKRNAKVVSHDIQNVDNMTEEEVSRLVEIDSAIEKLKGDAKSINSDESIDSETKEELINELKNNAETLHNEKVEIITKERDSKKTPTETTVEEDIVEQPTEEVVKDEAVVEEDITEPITEEEYKSKVRDVIDKWEEGLTELNNSELKPDSQEYKDEIKRLKKETDEALKELRSIEIISPEMADVFRAAPKPPSPEVVKERERSKSKLKDLRDKKNKRMQDLESMKKEAVSYVKSILGVEDLNAIKKSEFNTIVQQIRDAKNEKSINTLIDTLLGQVDTTRKRRADKRIGKLLKTKLKDKKGRALVSQDAIDVITAIKNNDMLNMSDSKLSEIVANNPDNENIQEAVEIVRLIQQSNSESISKENAAAFIEEALDKLDTVITEGRTQAKIRKEQDAARKKENIKEARVDSSRKSREVVELQEDLADIKKEKDNEVYQEKAALVLEKMASITGDNFFNEAIDSILGADLDTAKELMKEATQIFYSQMDLTKLQKSKNVFKDKIVQTYRYVSSDLDTLVDMISKKMHKSFLGGYLHSKISDGVRIAEEAYMKMTRVNKTKIHDKLIEIYKDTYPSIISKMGDLVDSIVVDTNKKFPTGVYKESGEEIELSRSNIMWLYNQYKNEKLHPNFDNAGLTSEVMEKLINEVLTKEDIAFADWLTDNFYEEMYAQVNPVFNKIYGRNMPKVDNYTGQIRYQGVDGVKSTDMLSDSGYSRQGTELFFGSGIDRVDNSRKISTDQDIFNSLFNYVNSANRFASSAEIYRDVKEILNDDVVTDNLKKYNRGDIKSQIEKLVDLSFGFKDRRNDISYINFLINAKILSSLALTPKILVTQAISTSLWLTENAGQVMANAMKFVINPIEGVKLGKEIYNNSEYIRNRYSDQAGYKKIEAAYIAENKKIASKNRFMRMGKKAKHKLFGQVALGNVMLGDAVGMFMLGIPYYKVKKDEGLKKFNGDEQRAIEYAITEFNKRASKNQQSYQSNDRDIAQHTDLGKIANMYGNSPKQYHRNTVQALMQVKRALQGREIKGTVGGNMWKAFLNHSIQGMLYQWVGTAMVGLLSDDDKEGTKLKDLIWGATFGSFSKFLVAGDLIQAFWDTNQGRSYGKTPSFTPIMSDYAKFFTEYANYKEAIEKNDYIKAEEVSSELYKVMLDLVGVPASKTSQLVNNYEKIIDGRYDSDEEMWLRILNYSDYQVSQMNQRTIDRANKDKAKKAAATRKRRKKDKK